MRVLFVLSGHIWKHTLPEGFREAGHDVMVIPSGSPDEISNILERYQPQVAISIGWGKEQSSKNLLILRRCFKTAHVPHIYWSVEDPAYTIKFSVPLIQKMQPDYIFTICRESADYFQRLGFRAAYMDFGFSPHIHHDLDCEKVYDIAVVANAYPKILLKHPEHFRNHSLKILVEPLLKHKMRVDFWGKGWAKMQNLYEWGIPPEWIHSPVNYQDTAKIYHSARILLGLQNYSNQVTQRTYEIIGSGCFLLTVDTPGVREILKPGKDLVCSGSPDQTLELVRYYLNNPKKCSRIAAHGQSSVAAYTYRHRAEYMLDLLKKANVVEDE